MLILTILLLIGCGPIRGLLATPTPEPTYTPFPTQTPYPTFTPVPTIDLPAVTRAAASTPVSTLNATIPISSTVGTVHGTAINKYNGEPVSKERVVLATVTSVEGMPLTYKFVLSYHPDEQGYAPDNSAYTDTMGAFLIQVPPGTYVLLSPGNPFKPIDTNVYAEDPVTGNRLIIKVVAGVTIDLGEIQMLQMFH
jgi:hypothetical protein